MPAERMSLPRRGFLSWARARSTRARSESADTGGKVVEDEGGGQRGDSGRSTTPRRHVAGTGRFWTHATIPPAVGHRMAARFTAHTSRRFRPGARGRLGGLSPLAHEPL